MFVTLNVALHVNPLESHCCTLYTISPPDILSKYLVSTDSPLLACALYFSVLFLSREDLTSGGVHCTSFQFYTMLEPFADVQNMSLLRNGTAVRKLKELSL